MTERNYRVGNLILIAMFFSLIFMDDFEEKNHRNNVYKKLQGFEQASVQARFAIPEISLTLPHYRGAIFTFCYP